MITPLDIGRLLVDTRRARGVTQHELGVQLGVSQPQIARWEAAEYRSASLANVDATARALGLALGEPLPFAAEAPSVYSADVHVEGILARCGVRSDTIAAFCRSHRIRELAVFGSLAVGDFGPTSDVDLVATWDDGHRPSSFGRLEDMQTELAGIFRRRVDLVDRDSVDQDENYIRRSSILGSARTIYARR